MAAPTQRRALGALFFVLAVAFAGVAWAAVAAGGSAIIIAVAAAAIALWLASLAAAGLRR